MCHILKRGFIGSGIWEHWWEFKKYSGTEFQKASFLLPLCGFLSRKKSNATLHRCLLWRSLKSRRGCLGRAKGPPVSPAMLCQLGPLMTARSSDVVGSQRAWGQVCVLAFLEAPAQQCEAAVDLCKDMACLAQGEKTTTSLVLFLIFEWSLSSQRWGQSARQEARPWGTSSWGVAHTSGSSKLGTESSGYVHS